MFEEANDHALSIEEVIQRLDTSSEGLSVEEYKKRLSIYGKNILYEEKFSKLALFFRQFNNIMIYILFAASVFSAVTEKWVDFSVIMLMIVINSIIGYIQELKAHVSIEALKKLTQAQEKVLRDKKPIEVPSEDLVIGDCVVLTEGDTVGADIRLIESRGLMADESSLTGESLPVIKDHSLTHLEKTLIADQKNMLHAGTHIVRGQAKGIVVATGKNTYFAKIARHSGEKSPDTPLMRALSFFAKKYVLAIVGLLLIMGIVSFFQKRPLFEIIYFLVAELVSAVPEGLYIVITVVMVIGAMALSKKKTFIRHLPAVETLGSATVVAIDKTGTITEGKLTIKDFFASDKQRLKLCSSLCNDAHEHSWKDPIDSALAGWVENFRQIREEHPRVWEYPFDVKKRLMATANTVGNEKKVFIKGAFESIKKIAVNSDEYERKMIEMSNRGLRVITMAEGDFTTENIDQMQVKILGLVGFLDPAKKEVKEAVAFAKKANIHILMLTGDYPLTAKAIAHEVGIADKEEEIVTGEEIDRLNDIDLLHKLKTIKVFARILPEHKYKIVKLLQKNQEIVAVTGDGINDMPALKAADLGIAMGSGAEAAKSVSKMIIGDNNLNVIMLAIKNGRIIADNIRKVIYYLMSTAMQEMTLISLAILFNYPLPLAPIQILWINIVTDGVQDKTFPFAKEEEGIMDRSPRRPQKQFIDQYQVFHVVFFGLVMGFLSLVLFIYLLRTYPYENALTITFTSVVFIQWANGIQAQKEKEPFFMNLKKSFMINPYIFLGVGVGLVLQFFAIYALPVGFHVVPMSLLQWKYPIIAFIVSLIVVEIRKWLEIGWKNLVDKRGKTPV